MLYKILGLTHIPIFILYPHLFYDWRVGLLVIILHGAGSYGNSDPLQRWIIQSLAAALVVDRSPCPISLFSREYRLSSTTNPEDQR